MALLWCDGFDHYGTIGKLTDGAWAEIGSQITLSSANPRTGTYHLRSAANFSSATTARRVLGGAKTSVGLATVFYTTSLPTIAQRDILFAFMDAANVAQVTIGLDTTGTITAWRGTVAGTALGTTASPVFVANAYQHVEAFVLFSNTVGTVEVRVNGVTVLTLTSQDTVATANVECSQVRVAGTNSAGTATTIMDFDDVFCYDNAGTYNNAFIGDRRVLTLFPNANTATADWTAVGAATGYECIDEANPDEDTTYITADTTGLISEFGLQNLPGGISAISAVVMVERARKTDAGTANTQISIHSGASTTTGANKALTEVYTFRQDVFEIDPASAAPFTPTEVNALQFKVERTA